MTGTANTRCWPTGHPQLSSEPQVSNRLHHPLAIGRYGAGVHIENHGSQQRIQEAQDEQIEWLALQTELLRDIRKHTGFMYNLLVLWLILTVLGLVVFVIAAVTG